MGNTPSFLAPPSESATDAKFARALKQPSAFSVNLAACPIDETHTIQTWERKRLVIICEIFMLGRFKFMCSSNGSKFVSILVFCPE